MRKSTFYLLLSFLLFALLISVCFIFNLPSNFVCNTIRFVISLFCILFYLIHIFHKDQEFINDSDFHIKELKEKYNYINTIALIHANLLFTKLQPNFIEKYKISIDSFDTYLLDFEANIESFINLSSKKQIDNEFISVACVMDSLVSAWKIKPDFSQKIISDDDFNNLVTENCQLAVAVALSLLNLPYETLKENPYIKRLINLLTICYLDESYGSTIIIENEALILELLYNDFLEKK